MRGIRAAGNEKGGPSRPAFPESLGRLSAYAVSDWGSIFTPGPMVELSEIFFT